LGNIHAPTVHTYKDQHVAPDNIAWNYGYKEDKSWSTRYRGAESPWQEEWNVLIAAIRRGRLRGQRLARGQKPPQPVETHVLARGRCLPEGVLRIAKIVGPGRPRQVVGHAGARNRH
jgi:hypothetical protein